MKKFVVIIAALCAALAVGCASTPPASDMMASAKNGAPDGALVGQATGSSEQMADADAKYQLTRAMSFIVKDMVDAAVAVIDSVVADQFRQQGVNTALGKLNLSGAVKQGSGKGKDGYWAVYSMDKSEVTRAINQAVASGKAAFPAAAPFTIEGRIDKAYAAQAAKEWKKS